MVLGEPIKITPLEIPPEMPPVAQVLWNARQYITPEANWTKGYYHEGGAACAIGSISSGNRDVELKYKARAKRFLQSRAKKRFGVSVQSYNDSYANHKQILSFFDEAIQLALELGK